jgi:hypothetical protein
VIGTTAVFGYVQAFAMSGSMMVEVNLESTVLSDTADVSLFGPAGEILPLIDKTMSDK